MYGELGAAHKQGSLDGMGLYLYGIVLRCLCALCVHNTHTLSLFLNTYIHGIVLRCLCAQCVYYKYMRIIQILDGMGLYLYGIVLRCLCGIVLRHLCAK